MDYARLKQRTPAAAGPVPPSLVELLAPAATRLAKCVVEWESARGRMRVLDTVDTIDLIRYRIGGPRQDLLDLHSMAAAVINEEDDGLHVDLFAAGGGAVNVTADTVVAFRADGASVLSCTIANGTSSCTNSGTSSAVAADSLVSFAVLSGASSAGNFFRFGVACK